MGFELRWPSGGVYTEEWDTEKNPIVDGSDEARNLGVFQRLLADQETQITYEIAGNTGAVWQFDFDISEAERAALVAFGQAVGGDPFDFREDPACGSVVTYTKVKGDEAFYRPRFQRIGNARYRVRFALRRQP